MAPFIFTLVSFALGYGSKNMFSSVQFSHSVVSDSLRSHELQHARPPCPSPTPRVHSDSRAKTCYCDLYQRMYCVFFLGVLWFPVLYLGLSSEMIFVWGLRSGSNFILFTCNWTVFRIPQTKFSNTLKGVYSITKWDLSEGYKYGLITLYLVWLVYHKPTWNYIKKLKNKNHIISIDAENLLTKFSIIHWIQYHSTYSSKDKISSKVDKEGT